MSTFEKTTIKKLFPLNNQLGLKMLAEVTRQMKMATHLFPDEFIHGIVDGI